MVTVRIRDVSAWLPTVAAAVVAAYLAVGAAGWCWEGAYNVLQGDSPAYGSSAVLIVAGLLPVVAAGAYCIAMRRSGQPRRSSLMFASGIAVVVSLFVIVFRAAAGGGF